MPSRTGELESEGVSEGASDAEDGRWAAASFFPYTSSARSSSLTEVSYETTRSKSRERLRDESGASDFQVQPTRRSVS